MYIFFFNDTATTEIYTLSLHDALPIFEREDVAARHHPAHRSVVVEHREVADALVGDQLTALAHLRVGAHGQHGRRHHLGHARSEEHTSELQSRQYLVCRLLLEKKK